MCLESIQAPTYIISARCFTHMHRLHELYLSPLLGLSEGLNGMKGIFDMHHSCLAVVQPHC